MNEQQFEAGERVVIGSGPMEGTTGRIRRKKGSLINVNENLWIIDYDGYSPDDIDGCGYHSPHELQHIQ